MDNEASIFISGTKGFIKVGGIALNKIEESRQDGITEIARLKEQLSISEISLQNSKSSNIEAQNCLREIHAIWESLGISLKEREFSRKQIERCLEDTCARSLESAKDLQNQLQ